MQKMNEGKNLELQEEVDWINETQPSRRLPSADCGTSQE